MSSTTASESRWEATVQVINSGFFLKKITVVNSEENLLPISKKNINALAFVASRLHTQWRETPAAIRESLFWQQVQVQKLFQALCKSVCHKSFALNRHLCIPSSFYAPNGSASSLKVSLKHASAAYGGAASAKMWTVLKKKKKKHSQTVRNWCLSGRNKCSEHHNNSSK